MTWREIDPSELGDYVGRYVQTVSDYGWDMDGWGDEGYLRGVEDGYFFLQSEDDNDEFEHFTDLGGAAISCIRSVAVRMP
jgi:hypothetical protein